MKPLPISYNKNGFTFNQIIREGDVAVYEQIIPETGKRIAYEVFEVMKKKAATINGSIIEARETSPSNEQWGTNGFTVYDLSHAKVKQGILSQAIRNRQESKTCN